MFEFADIGLTDMSLDEGHVVKCSGLIQSSIMGYSIFIVNWLFIGLSLWDLKKQQLFSISLMSK